MKKLFWWLAENLPIVFIGFLGFAHYTAGEIDVMRFYILLGLFYFVFKDLREIRDHLRKTVKDEETKR